MLSLRARTSARAAAACGTVLLAASVLSAAPASADQTWHQSVGRATADATCPTDLPAEVESGWTAWGASWAKWANDGTGGYTCDRANTWARDASDAPSGPYPGCVTWNGVSADFGDIPYQVGGGPIYLGADCTDYLGVNGYPLVYAPNGQAQADALCDQYDPAPDSAAFLEFDPIWYCANP